MEIAVKAVTTANSSRCYNKFHALLLRARHDLQKREIMEKNMSSYSMMESLVDFYLNEKFYRDECKKSNMKIFPYQENTMELFSSDMTNGMPYYISFLNDPIKFLEQHECAIYFYYEGETMQNKKIGNLQLYSVSLNTRMVYTIVHQISVEQYIFISILIDKDMAIYCVDNYENTMEQIKGKKEISIKKFNTILANNLDFFKTQYNRLIECIKTKSQKYINRDVISDRWKLFLESIGLSKSENKSGNDR